MSKKLMNAQKRIKYVIIAIALIVIAVVTIRIVNAMSWKFQVSADKTEARPGDNVYVSMKISDIDMGDLGINAIESILEYDDNVFETVTRDDIKTQNNWTITYNQEAGPKEGNFLISNIISGIKTNQDVGIITFKIREDVGPQETVIRFKDVKSNDGSNLVKEDDKEIRIKILENEELPQTKPSETPSVVPSPMPSATTTPKPTETGKLIVPEVTNNGNGNNANGQVVNSPKNELPSVIPQTGIGTGLIAIIIIAVVNAGIILIRYKKIEY